MRILIDTNILISAALNSHGTPYKAYLKAVTYPNKGIICDQNIEELWRIFNRKFPTKISMLEKFLAYSLSVIEVATTPEMEEDAEKLIRDAHLLEEAGCFAAAMSTLKLEASGPFSKTEEDVWNIIRTSSLKAEKI